MHHDLYNVPNYVTRILDATTMGSSFVILELSKLINRGVIITDNFYQPIWVTPKNSEISIDYIDPIPLTNEEIEYQKCFLKVNGIEKEAICKPLKGKVSVKGYLFIVGEENLEELMNQYGAIINFTHKALELEYLKNEEIRLQKKKFQDVFLHDLIYGNINNEEEILSYGELWDWDFSLNHTVVVFALNDFDFSPDDLNMIDSIEYAIKKIFSENYQSPVLLKRKNELVLIHLFHSKEPIANLEKLILSVKTFLKNQSYIDRMQIGIGNKRSNSVDIFQTYQEAKVALGLGEMLDIELPFFSKLGLERILYNHDIKEVNDFYYQVLGKLIDEDKINESSLIETLESLVKNQFDLTKTAEAMYIHKNTLRYRIKKIEEILNDKLTNIELRVNIIAAVKIKQLRKVN